MKADKFANISISLDFTTANKPIAPQANIPDVQKYPIEYPKHEKLK